MTASVMDGRTLASQIKERLRGRVREMNAAGVSPKLATILVGDDPASKVYVGNKHKAAQEVGIFSENHELAADTDGVTLSRLITELNGRRDVHGILLQLPLPRQLDPRRMIETISPEKDVDGLTSSNMGLLFYGQQVLVPCTPKGIMELFRYYGVPLRGSSAVIINRSALVGKPLYHLLVSEDATVTTCHSKTREISRLTREADILITAAGRRPDFIVTADMVKEGAVVVDVATNRIGGKFVGDVDYESVSEKASMITPVPGGVGPMTVAMLLENTLIAVSEQKRLERSVEASSQVSG